MSLHEIILPLNTSLITLNPKLSFIIFFHLYSSQLSEVIQMEKFFVNMQKSHNYTDYEIKVIRYFLLTMVSELSKLIVIFTFFACIGRFTESLVCLTVLLILRTTGGGIHCEHYISCFIVSFMFTLTSVFLAELITPNGIVMIVTLLICNLIAYKMVPVVSYHRPKPTEELIKRSRRTNFTFLFFITVAVILFHTNRYVTIIFWLCVLHSIQLLLTKLEKGGKYHV